VPSAHVSPKGSGDGIKESSMNPMRKILIGGAMAGSAVLGGALGATMLGTAYAQEAQTTTSTAAPAVAADPSTTTDPATATAPADAGATGRGGHGPHSANGITETELTGDQATSAIAAAEAANPGATVDKAETDAEGAAFEVHMTKADGSQITVKLGADFAVTETIAGRG
jgi:hypothetical protein